MMKALLLGASLLAALLPQVAQAIGTTIVSDRTWTVTDVNGNDVGTAQNVCLSAASPANCPAGATLYGFQAPLWTANFSATPGATWIWANNITGTTTNAANAEFVFQKMFYLCDVPVGGSISVAADDFAEVFLNGVSVLKATGYWAASTVNIAASSLMQGANVITVKAKNGGNLANCTAGQYSCNPAGMILSASFQDQATALPTCRGNNGSTFQVGQFEPLACPPGNTGSKARLCICVGKLGVWGATFDNCTPPQPTCRGSDGSPFSPGSTETLSCPAGTSGTSTHTCRSDGAWGPTTNNCVTPPLRCSGNGGKTFAVGESETLACPSGQTGSQARVCQANGNWGATSGVCSLPSAAAGELCGSKEQGVLKACPAGTTCGSRLLPAQPKPWYCAVFGIDCPVRLQTADWFCEP